MNTEYIDEYVTFCHYLNFSHAARQLNMSQSNLSKHIRHLENEVGTPLVARGDKLSLTAAGEYFLNKSISILNDLSETISHCREISISELNPLVVRKPTYFDTAAINLYSHLDKFKSAFPGTQIRFAEVERAHPFELLRTGKVDVQPYYQYANVPDIFSLPENKDLFCCSLGQEEIVAYCHVKAPFATKTSFSVDDLRTIPILETSQLYAPLMQPIKDICNQYGFNPTFQVRDVSSFPEMLLLDEPLAIRIFPKSISKDPMLAVNSEMTCIPIRPKLSVQSFLLMRSTPENETAKRFKLMLETMKENA